MKKVALCVSHGLKIMNKFKLLKLDKFDVDVFQLQPYSKESILTEFKNHYTINWGKSPSFTDDIILKFYELMIKANMKRNREISNNFLYDICVDVKSNIQIKRDLNSIPSICRFSHTEEDFELSWAWAGASEKRVYPYIKPKTIYIYDKIKLDKRDWLEIYDDRMFYSDSICFDVMGTIFKNLLYFTADDIDDKFLFMYFVNMFRFANGKM